jgi:hypothetical protein
VCAKLASEKPARVSCDNFFFFAQLFFFLSFFGASTTRSAKDGATRDSPTAREKAAAARSVEGGPVQRACASLVVHVDKGSEEQGCAQRGG